MLQSLFPKRGFTPRAPETRAAVSSGTTGWTIVRGTTPSDFQGTGAEVRRNGWERHPVVNACVRAIADLIAAVPLEVYRKTNDESTVLPDHEALGVFRGDGGRQSEYRLKSRTATHFLTYGNAFWKIERRGRTGPPTAIRVINPDAIQYVWLEAQTDLIRAYDWRDLQGTVHQQEPVENLIHFRDLDAGDGLFGFPRFAAALRDILSDNEASEYVREVVTNHGTPGLAIMTEGAATQEELTAAEAKFKEKWVTRGNRGATAFMAGVKELVPIGFNLNELEFPDLRSVTREDICTAANVDPRIIGVSSASKDGGLSGVQYAEARFRLIQQSVYPVMRAIEDELNFWLMPEFGDVYVRFSEDYLASITEDLEKTSTRVLAEVGAKVRTVEEAREAIGLDADMDPTHTLPGGMQVGAAAENAQAMADATLEATKNPPKAIGDAPPARAAIAPAPPLLTRAASPAWESFDERARREEEAYIRAALAQFAIEAHAIDTIIRGIQGGDPYVEAALARILADYAPSGAYHAQWLSRYTKLISHTVRVGGEVVAGSVGVSFTLENPRAQSIIRQRAGALVQHVTETTREAIRGAVELGRAQGMGVRQIADLIHETTFGEITKGRALTIARTETVGALNAAEYLAATSDNIMRSKTWLTQGDDRVRDSHADLNNMRIDIGSAFPNGLRYPHEPGAPAEEVVNCRCTLLFSDEEAHRAARVDPAPMRLDVRVGQTAKERSVELTKVDGMRWVAKTIETSVVDPDVTTVEV